MLCYAVLGVRYNFRDIAQILKVKKLKKGIACRVVANLSNIVWSHCRDEMLALIMIHI